MVVCSIGGSCGSNCYVPYCYLRLSEISFYHCACFRPKVADMSTDEFLTHGLDSDMDDVDDVDAVESDILTSAASKKPKSKSGNATNRLDQSKQLKRK